MRKLHGMVAGLVLGLGFNFNLHAAPALLAQPPAQNDSLVSLVADVAGLQLLSPDQVPPTGTFWWVDASGISAPLPCPPSDSSGAIYQIASGQYLVDTTGGQVALPPQRLGMQVSAAAVVNARADALANQIDQIQADASQQTLATGQRMSAMSAGGIPSPGGGAGDGSGDYTPNGSSSIIYNPTNLWIAQTAVAAGNLTGIGTNTLADVQYQIQSRTNLAQSDWQSEGFIFGSELTNWTPLSVPQFSRTNLFIRLQSWASSDGSGLPDWWEQLYFGTNGVDPNADPAGDGWSNIQKFQNGWNPSQFYTPAAPQGMVVNFNQSAQTAVINWQPSVGAVTSYTVEKTYKPNWHSSVQISDHTASTAEYTDGIANNTTDPYSGNTYLISYRVQAHYANGGSSTWSPQVSLQPVATISGVIAPDANGATDLAVSGVPANASAVRLIFVDLAALDAGDPSFDYSENIPVASISNGMFQLPAAWLPPNEDAYGDSYYQIHIQSVDASGNASVANLCGSVFQFGFPQYVLGQPFYDGRVELKQNLIFQLRAAPVDGSLQFSDGVYYYYPTNYSSAGLYPFYNLLDQLNYDGYDVFLPFEENYMFKNFVLGMANVDGSGNLTTGVSGGNGNIYYYLSNPTYLFDKNITPYQAILSSANTRWMLYAQLNDLDDIKSVGVVNSTTDDSDETTISMPNGSHNWFGLPYRSINILAPDYITGDLVENVVSAGGSSTSENYTYSLPNIYTETAQPQFSTVEYDFWNPTILNASSTEIIYPLPGDSAFSPTNQSQPIIVGVGSQVPIAGYAKLAVVNSVIPGVYGYLGQYFTNAFRIAANGNVTATNTGVLTPYGSFFATEAGPVAVVTMPDIDTGQQGTCTVYAVSIALDKNHDGNMDLSFNSTDATSLNSPYFFWRNNNYDRWDYDTLSLTSEQDDLIYATQTDYDYRDETGNRIIPCTRDLEDYARLWVCGVTTNLLAALPAGSTVTLSWGDVGNPNSANPTIDLFTAADADGGTGYLTNSTSAANQIDPVQSVYIGRVGPGQSLQLNASKPLQFGLPYNWQGSHYIWCGVSNGTGGLTLTIADANSNVLAQTMAYIQIQDIKQMYERWTVGDNASKAPLTTAIKSTQNLPIGDSAFQYTSPTDANTPYILLVHGYNMAAWEKDRYAETAFKRLYWQGYQGRFGAFNWPTEDNPLLFGSSELQAWNSAQGLLNKLNDLNAIYPGHVYLAAHSLGNVVAGEALRLAGNSQVVNTYVAMQGAVTAHAYDPTTAIYQPADDHGELDCYAHYWTNGAPCYFNASAGAGTYVNFYNTNDWALRVAWLEFQDQKINLSPGYIFGSGGTYYKNYGLIGASDQLFFPTNTYELFDHLFQCRSLALGMQPGVLGAFQKNSVAQQIDLQSDWPPDIQGYTAHLWHSAEFRSDNAQRWLVWNQVLIQMKLKLP